MHGIWRDLDGYTPEAIALTADLYKRYQTEDVYSLCVEEVKEYINIVL